MHEMFIQYWILNKTGGGVQIVGSNGGKLNEQQVAELVKMFRLVVEKCPGKMPIAWVVFDIAIQPWTLKASSPQGGDNVAEYVPYIAGGAADRIVNPTMYGQESFTAEEALAAVMPKQT